MPNTDLALRNVKSLTCTIYMYPQIWTAQQYAPLKLEFSIAYSPTTRQTQRNYGHQWHLHQIFDLDEIIALTLPRHRYHGWLNDMRMLVENAIALALNTPSEDVYNLRKLVIHNLSKRNVNTVLASNHTEG